MAETSLAGVWAKIARADDQFQLLEREMRAFFDRDPEPIGTSVGYFDSESGWHISYGVVNEEPPPRLGVILGELVHNVRSALDHLVWQLVIWNDNDPVPGVGGNAFPFAMTKNAWKGAQKGPLAGVADKHRAIIREVQPYKGSDGPENTVTADLSHLSNVDKHQIVHPTLATILDPGAGPHRASFRVVEGEAEIVQEQVNFGASFEHGAPLMRCRTEPPNSGIKVHVEGDIPGDIAFGERRVRFGCVKNFPQVARVIVREFEPDIPS